MMRIPPGVKISYRHDGMPPLDGSMTVTAKVNFEAEVEVGNRRWGSWSAKDKELLVKQLVGELLEDLVEFVDENY